MHRFSFLALGLFASAALVCAIETRTWIQTESSEFEKGTLKNLSIASDGRVTLAPQFKELFDPSVPYLWATAVDSKGNTYAGGSGGAVFTVDPQGKGRKLADLSGGDVYAIAINAKDEVFAALSPEAKVYRVPASGKPELFYDAKEKYIWSMAFHPSGDLYLGTGDQGKVHRVQPDGTGRIVFESGETHVRALALDAQGNVIAGTEPGGLVIRVTPAGQGFVLYQLPRREITAVAIAKDGAVYAAGVGGKPTAPVVPAPTPAPAPQPSQPPPSGTSASTGGSQPRPVNQPPSLNVSSLTVAGSDIYRILPDGEPLRVWTNSQQVVYGLAFDARNRLIAATGNQGVLYRIDSERQSTRLRDAEPSQITSICRAPSGAMIVATANSGKIFQLGPTLEKSGTLESESFDAGSFTYWGRLRFEGSANGGAIALETRSGNLERQQNHWSPWAAAPQRVSSPPARFLAWRATLTASADGRSPELTLVEAAYQAKNVAPELEQVEITPANYRFPASSLSLSSSSNLTLPPIGQTRRSSPSTPNSEAGGTQTMNYDKGSIGARWRASDSNGDTMQYRLEIRGAEEKEWKLLKDEVKDGRYSWDSTAFADGRYLLRVIANDNIDNYPGQGLTAEIVSERFVIDNTPPQITGLTARLEGQKIMLRFKGVDAWTPLVLAEYSLNGGDWVAVEPTSRLTDSLDHDYSVPIEKGSGTEFVIAVRVTDENDNVAVQKVVVR